MIIETGILERTHHYVASRLPLESHQELNEKDLNHANALVAVAEEIGKATGLTEKEIQIIMVAAWLYNLRLTEDKGLAPGDKIIDVDGYLQSSSLTASEIAKINACIAAAQFPQHPYDTVEEVFCDAVASFLASPNYLTSNSNQVTKELINPVEAYERSVNQLELFKKQAFFTKYAKKKYADGKAENLKKLKKEKKVLTKENGELEVLWEENKKLKKDLEKEKEQKTSKGIETMFRTTMASHLQLSVMADTKANLMISINAIIASIMISSFLRNVHEVPYLIIPSILLTLVCILTVVFAVLSTRPNIKTKPISVEKSDLLFFGDFVHLTSESYKESVRNMMLDHEKLYNSMIDNIYQQGKVMAKKYLLLKISYTVFMVGFGIVLASYAISYVFFSG